MSARKLQASQRQEARKKNPLEFFKVRGIELAKDKDYEGSHLFEYLYVLLSQVSLTLTVSHTSTNTFLCT